MNVYEISYQAALDGEYQKKIDRYDPFGRYFDERGASVYRRYADTDLQIASNHLQNVVNLIYSGRKHGIDEIEIRLIMKEVGASCLSTPTSSGIYRRFLQNLN